MRRPAARSIPGSTGPARVGLVGWLVCLFYVAVLAWEVLFVLAIERS